MKRFENLLIKVMVVLFVAAMGPVAAHAADLGIEQLTPSETQETDTSGSHFIASPSKPRIIPSETQVVDTSGTPWMAVKSSKETWKIEQLVPSETQEVDAGGATR